MESIFSFDFTDVVTGFHHWQNMPFLFCNDPIKKLHDQENVTNIFPQ